MGKGVGFQESMNRRDAINFLASVVVGFAVFIAAVVYTNLRTAGQLVFPQYPLARCGNWIADLGEMCDDGPGGSAFCTPFCTLSQCGDTYLNPSADEECDDGNFDPGDGCDATCKNEFMWDGGSAWATCGNGVVEEPEWCDDGNAISGDGCSATCTVDDEPPVEAPPPCAGFGEECTAHGAGSFDDPRCCDGLQCYTGESPSRCVDFCKKVGEGPCRGTTPDAGPCCGDSDCNAANICEAPLAGCRNAEEECVADGDCCQQPKQPLFCRMQTDGRQVCTADRCPGVASSFTLSKKGLTQRYKEKVVPELMHSCVTWQKETVSGMCFAGPYPNCTDGRFLGCVVQGYDALMTPDPVAAGVVKCSPVPGSDGKRVECTLTCVCSRECEPK